MFSREKVNVLASGSFFSLSLLLKALQVALDV